MRLPSDIRFKWFGHQSVQERSGQMLTTTISQTGMVPSNTISEDAAQLRPINPVNLPRTRRRMIRTFERSVALNIGLKFSRNFPNIMQSSCHIS